MEVEGLNDFSLEFEGIEIAIKKGEKKRIKPHLATILEKNGIVSMKCVDDVFLRKKVMEERANASLTGLPEDFYELLSLSLKKIKSKDEKKFIKTLAPAKDLLKLRIEKLEKMALRSKSSRPKLELIEEILLSKIMLLIKEFEYNALEKSLMEER
ncbi:MAG: hypothetical protein ACXQTP_07195 [Candidatus Methanofastidiosia archaeon]